jgi:hypothetical protein
MLGSAVLRDLRTRAATDRKLVDFRSSSGNQYRLFIAALAAVFAGLLVVSPVRAMPYVPPPDCRGAHGIWASRSFAICCAAARA